MKTISSGKVIGARRAMGDYSAIVKVQETDVWAENEYGGMIAEGEAGVDDAKVIQKAVDYVHSKGGGEVKIREGTYKCLTTIIGKDCVDLIGSGFSTILDFSEIGVDTQFTIQMGNYSRLANLKLTGSISPLPNSLRQMIYPGDYCVIERIWIDKMGRGIDCGNSNLAGRTNVKIKNCIFTNIRDSDDWAACIHCGNNASNIFVENCIMKYSNRGIEIDDGFNNGVFRDIYMKDIKNYNATGNEAFSINIHSHSGKPACKNITFENVYLDGCEPPSCWGADADNIPTNISFVHIRCYNPIGHGKSFEGDNVEIRDFKIDFSNYSYSASWAYYTGGDAKNMIFDNFRLYGFKGYGGLSISSGSVKINIVNSRFIADSESPGNQAIGVYGSDVVIEGCKFLGTSASNGHVTVWGSRVIIANNYFENKFVYLRETSTDVKIVKNIVVNATVVIQSGASKYYARDNIGYNPQSVASITVGDSPFTYQNTDPYPVDIIISGGDVSKIEWSRDGSTWYDTGVTAGKIHLEPGEYIRVTYSTTAPTMTKVPL